MSHDLYQHRYLRTTKRATFHDYEGGWYFITICTANRAHYFGEIAKENNENHLHLSSIGTYLAQQIDKTEKIRHDMNVAIPVYAIMPDHVHLLINIGENKYNTRTDAMLSICGDAMPSPCTDAMPPICTDAMLCVATKKTGTKWCPFFCIYLLLLILQ